MRYSFPLYIDYDQVVYGSYDNPLFSRDIIEPSCILNSLTDLPSGSVATVHLYDTGLIPNHSSDPNYRTLLYGCLTLIPIHPHPSTYRLYILHLRNYTHAAIPHTSGYLLDIYPGRSIPLFNTLVDCIPRAGHIIHFMITVPTNIYPGELNAPLP